MRRKHVYLTDDLAEARAAVTAARSAMPASPLSSRCSGYAVTRDSMGKRSMVTGAADRTPCRDGATPASSTCCPGETHAPSEETAITRARSKRPIVDMAERAVQAGGHAVAQSAYFTRVT